MGPPSRLPLSATSAAEGEDNCASAPNPIVCENALPGDPKSDWDVEGVGDPTIQGYATSMSVNAGQTESFKIKTPASAYHIDILRLGYYGGDGARLVASDIKPTAKLPQSQPECLKEPSTGLIDCGNWGVSASWTVPSNAVSGVYIAHLVRNDTGGDSQIIFVVRNDSSHSEILAQTSDATWQAYNDYGGNSLYTCTVACPPGEPEGYKAAYAVSYNRPFDGSFETDGGTSYLYYAEYQMIHWLEQNGYDVSYTSEAEVDQQRRPAQEPQDLHLQRPRRVLVGGAARKRGSGTRGRRQPRLLQRQRDVLEDALGTEHRRLEHALPDADHLQGDALRRPGRPQGSADVDRSLARSALQPARRRRASRRTPSPVSTSWSTRAPPTSPCPPSTASCDCGATPPRARWQPGQR